MPAFLIHGVPDTHRVWDALRARLARRDVVAPDLPGFGNAPPPDFTATKEAYVVADPRDRARRVAGRSRRIRLGLAADAADRVAASRPRAHVGVRRRARGHGVRVARSCTAVADA